MYGAEQKRFAVLLLSRDVSYSEVSELSGINIAYLRILKQRFADFPLGFETHIGSENAMEINEPEPVETSDVLPETISKTRPQKATLKDVVFYGAMLVACIGFWSVLRWYSLPLVLIYVLISVDALAMAKNPAIPKSARLGQNAVWVMETIAVPFHIALFNRALWANVSALPFDIREAVRSGEWYWQNGEKPFYCACFIAVLLFCAAIYSVNATLKVTTETSKTS